MDVMTLIPSPAAKYGGSLAAPSTSVSDTASPLPAVAGPSLSQVAPAWHPDSPLFWFGLIAAAAVGFAFASTTVRVGPVKAAASVGKS
jgi:hypothetical protein